MTSRLVKRALVVSICWIALVACGEDGDGPRGATPGSDPAGARSGDAAVRTKDAASVQPIEAPEPDYSSVPALPQLSYDMLKKTACADGGGSCIPTGDCAKKGGALLATYCPSDGKLSQQCCHVEEPCQGSAGAACCLQGVSNGTDVVATDRAIFCQGGHQSCLGKRNVIGYSQGGDCRMGQVLPIDETQPSLWPGAIGLLEATRKACQALGGTLGNLDTPGKPSVSSCDNPDDELLIVTSPLPCCVKKGACKPANPDADCCGSNGGGGYYRKAKLCVDGRGVCGSQDKEAPKGTCSKL